MRPFAAIRYRADRYLKRRSWKIPAHDQWVRTASLNSMYTKINELGPDGLTAAEISGENFRRFGWAHYETLDYPAFDLCTDVPSRTFDVVIAEHILEHVLNPAAAAELCGR